MTDIVVVPTLTPLPQYPTPEMDDAAYNNAAFLTTKAYVVMVDEMQAMGDATHTNASVAGEQAALASGSAVAASQAASTAADAANAAAAAAGAVKWVAGTYAEGAVVWSPTNGLMYRRRTAGNSTVDPATNNTGWWLIGAPLAAPIQLISANTAAQLGVHYVFGAALTLTLPTSPSVLDVVEFTDLSGSGTAQINPGSLLIRGIAGSMVLNTDRAEARLTYSGAEKGWI